MPQSSTLAIPSEESRLGEVREFVSRFSKQAGLADRAAANLRLAVDQVCSYVIQHAYADTVGEIRIELDASNTWLEVRVRDTGASLPGVHKGRDLMPWLQQQSQRDAASVQLHQLVDKLSYTPREGGNLWHLRKKLPHKRRFQGSLRTRYAVRSALVLGALITVACVPLWILEGQRHRESEEQALQALAFGLAESARPALSIQEPRSDEQKRLQESVMATRRRETRLLTLHIIDTNGLVRASDRSSALFTRFADGGQLGEPDAQGVQRSLRSIEGNPVMSLSMPVLGTHAQKRLLGQVVLTMRWDDVEARVQEARIRLLFGALLLYLIATLVVVALIGGILGSMQKVLDAMRSFQSEDDSFDLEGKGEGALAQAFSQVTSRMQAAENSAAQADVLRKDMVLAKEIQETILPQAAPEVPGYELAKFYKPAEDVGGDYYDFLTVNDDMVGVVVADVSGKGVSGSLVMGMLRTALRMEARDNTNAGDVLARMNAFLSADMRKGMFVTMFYVILDSRNRVVSYASAGHTPMILYRAETAETFFLKPRGFPVGLQLPDDQTFGRSLDVERLQLHEGDLLLLYTDGITEALNGEREQYGEDRLLQVIRDHAGGSAQGCVDAIQDDLDRFRGMTAQSDDVTIVAIRETSVVRSARGTVRQKLQDLVDNQGLSVEEACDRLQVSPSTYYRFQHAERAQTEESPAEVAGNIALDDSEGVAPGDEPTAETRKTDDETAPADAASANTAPPPSALRNPHAASTANTPSTADDTVVDRVDDPADDAAPHTLRSRELQGRLEPLPSHAGAATVWLEGFIDSSSCAEMEAYLRAVHEEWQQVVLDLSGILYLSSRAWGILASAAAELEQRGGQLLLTGLNAEVADVHMMLGFEDVLPTYASAHEARKALHAPGDNTAAAATEKSADGSARNESPRRHRKPRRRSEAKRRRKEKGRQNAAAQTSAAATPEIEATLEGPPVTQAEAMEGEWESLRVISGCVGPQGEVRLLGVEGILDTISTRRFAEVLESRLQKGDIRILVDLSRTEFISSAGWGVFASALRELRGQGGDLKLFGMGRDLKNIFQMLGLDAVLESFDVMAAALEAFGLSAPEPETDEEPTPVASEATPVAPGATPEDEFAAAIEADLEATRIGKLQVQVQTFGNSGNALRLIMEGELTGKEQSELSAWLRTRDPIPDDRNRLLLLDARRVQSADEEHWLSLLGDEPDSQHHWGSVHMLRPHMPGTLPHELGFPVHETLEEALEAYQNRSSARVCLARLDDPGQFSADASVRREGWSEYLKVLLQTHTGKEKT